MSLNLDQKHILFLSTSFAEQDRRIQRIISVLKESGYKISWLSRAIDKSFSLPNVSHYFIRTWFSSGPLFYLEYNLKTWWKGRKIQADIITAIDLDTLVSANYICESNDNKLVFDAHEYFSEVPELQGKVIKKRIWEYVARKYIPKTDAAYTVGSSLANVFSIMYKVPFSVIRNVPALHKEELVYSSVISNRDIIYLGVLNKGRGIEQMIDTIAVLPDPYRLILLGEGDIAETLMQKVNINNLKDRVIFKGWIPAENISQELSSAWCGINLLDSTSKSYFYSLANKYFDYLHAGLPVIVNDFPEYVSLNSELETSILISDLEVETISKAIMSLENKEFYDRLRSNAKHARQVWNMNKEKELLLDVYSSL